MIGWLVDYAVQGERKEHKDNKSRNVAGFLDKALFLLLKVTHMRKIIPGMFFSVCVCINV